jgi:hypothetical protein
MPLRGSRSRSTNQLDIAAKKFGNDGTVEYSTLDATQLSQHDQTSRLLLRGRFDSSCKQLPSSRPNSIRHMSVNPAGSLLLVAFITCNSLPIRTSLHFWLIASLIQPSLQRMFWASSSRHDYDACSNCCGYGYGDGYVVSLKGNEKCHFLCTL